MGLFGPNNIYQAKQVRFKKAKDSSAMQDLLKKKEVSAVLDKPEEVKEFYDTLRERAGGKGVSVKTLQETLGKLHEGKKSISEDEAFKLAKAIIPRGFDHYRSFSETSPQESRLDAIRRASAERRDSSVVPPKSLSQGSGQRFKSESNLRMNSTQFNRNFSGITPGVR